MEIEPASILVSVTTDTAESPPGRARYILDTAWETTSDGLPAIAKLTGDTPGRQPDILTVTAGRACWRLTPTMTNDYYALAADYGAPGLFYQSGEDLYQLAGTGNAWCVDMRNSTDASPNDADEAVLRRFVEEISTVLAEPPAFVLLFVEARVQDSPDGNVGDRFFVAVFDDGNVEVSENRPGNDVTPITISP